MAQELQKSGIWWGSQTAKTVENTTPSHRGLQVGGDFELNRDIGAVQVSDGTKYGSQIRYLNTMSGSGTPAIEGTPSELASLLWLMHGTETFTAGTNNVWTASGAPSSGAFTIKIYDGAQTMETSSLTNGTTNAAVDTAMETALSSGGYGATAVTVTGGPLNTTPLTITFDGTTGRGTRATQFYLSKGTDTTSPAVSLTQTTPAVRGKHSFSPVTAQGLWATFVRSVGTGVITRHSMLDCLIGGFTLECSQAQKDMRITPNLLSLDPYKIVAADPAATLPAGVNARPFIWQEAVNTLTLGTGVSTTTVNGQSSMTMTVNEDRSPAYGDDAVPYDFAVGTPTVAMSITMIFDTVGLARWNEMIYGVASPATGAKPLRNLGAPGSWSANWTQKGGDGNNTGNRMVITMPSINWDVPAAPPPNPAGGLAEITLGGSLAPTSNPYTVDIYNGDNAAYTS